MKQRSKWIKKSSLALGTVLMALSTMASTASADSNNVPAPTYPVPTPPTVPAQAVVLMDANNGQILYAKNATEHRAPASTTKIMSMYLVEQAIAAHQMSLNETIPITPDAYKVATEDGVSDAYLDPRETFTLEDMLKFIAVISANDATIAVADKLAGSQAAFVTDMNTEVAKLGLSGTHYMNPDGLPEANHYTTAYDLAKLSRDLVTQYPQILSYTALPQVTVRKGNTWPTTNGLLGKYPGVDGLKTGFTDAAGYCFVGTAEQNGVRLIAVVLGDTSDSQRFTDAASFFDYGFHQFSSTTVALAKQPMATTIKIPNAANTELQISPAENMTVDIPTGSKGNLVVTPGKNLKAPIAAGQVVGQATYMISGKPVVTVPVVALAKDNKAGFIARMWRSFTHFLGHLFHHL